MYTEKNYKTKKELIQDFKAGIKIRVYQPGGIFEAQRNGSIALAGPHYPQPHKWYASATIQDYIITSVK